MKTALRTRHVVAAWAVLGWLAAAAPAFAQDPLAAARALYASARYEEALVVLEGLRAGERPDRGDAVEADRRSLGRLRAKRYGETSTKLEERSRGGSGQVRRLAVEEYRSLCFLALGRDGEAEAAIAAVVSIDPFYLPDAREVAPGVRAFFRGVRQRLLPEIAQAKYAEAKVTYERKEFARAAEEFRRVLALVDDPDMAGRLADLRLLADGFEQLSAAAAPAPAAPAAPPTPGSSDGPIPPVESPPEEAGAAPPRVYGSEDTGVTPPIVVRQVLPPVPSGIQTVGRTRGLYEITIGETGRVTAVAIRVSLHAVYDRAFIESAVTWQYRPALLDGRPVKYRKRIQVSVAR